MQSIVRDLGGRQQNLIRDPASRPPYGRVRLRKSHTVRFSPLRMTRRGVNIFGRGEFNERLPLEVAKRHEGLRKQLSVVFPRV